MTMHPRSTARRVLGASILAALVGLLVVPATVFAAAPDNDDIGSPRVVASLPYSDGPSDTTEATTAATDPAFCYDPSAGADRSTVWYEFTPSGSGSFYTSTAGSDYDTTLYVGTADGTGGVNVIDCNDDNGAGLQSTVIWDATAGTTYLIMVGTCCGGGNSTPNGGGGNLILQVGVTPDPLPAMHVAISGRGSFSNYGDATIRGTIACEGGASNAFLELVVTEPVGRRILTGFGFIEPSECSVTPTPWEAQISTEDGRFRGGPVTVEAFAQACGPIFCASDAPVRKVQLRH